MDRKVIFNTAKDDIPIFQDFIQREIDRLSEIEESSDSEEEI